MAESEDQRDDRRSNGVLFDTYDWLAGEIVDSVPVFAQVQDSLMDALERFTHATHANIDSDNPVELARSRIATQADNDFLDLLHEAMSGQGRPAARTARSLFEHLVNHRWITRNATEAERYCDHAAIGELLDLDLNTPREADFTGAMRKRVRHWRRKLERRIRPAAEAVVKRYGLPFRSRWTDTNLRDRATQLGLGGEYDYYRLLSAVIHGSAGGDLGHRAEIKGASVVRTGPAVSVCPLALRTGLRYYKMFVLDVKAIVGTPSTAGVEQILDDLEGAMKDHEAVCQGIDQHLWPEEPPATAMFLRVDVDGSWVWLLFDREQDRTIRADPMNPDPAQMEDLEDLVAKAEAANPGRTKAMFIGAPHIRGTPRPSAPWLPAADTLRPRPPGPAKARQFRTLQVSEPQWDPSLHD